MTCRPWILARAVDSRPASFAQQRADIGERGEMGITVLPAVAVTQEVEDGRLARWVARLSLQLHRHSDDDDVLFVSEGEL